MYRVAEHGWHFRRRIFCGSSEGAGGSILVGKLSQGPRWGKAEGCPPASPSRSPPETAPPTDRDCGYVFHVERLPPIHLFTNDGASIVPRGTIGRHPKDELGKHRNPTQARRPFLSQKDKALAVSWLGAIYTLPPDSPEIGTSALRASKKGAPSRGLPNACAQASRRPGLGVSAAHQV